MRRWTALLPAIAMLLSLVGCGTNQTVNAPAEDGDAQAALARLPRLRSP